MSRLRSGVHPVREIPLDASIRPLFDIGSTNTDGEPEKWLKFAGALCNRFCKGFREQAGLRE